jgi:hypothetical protein
MPLRKEDTIEGAAEKFNDTSSHGTPYLVIRWKATGAWSCSCTDWAIRRNKFEDHTAAAPAGNHCKHVRRGIAGLLREAGVIFSAPPDRARLTGRAVSIGEDV